MTETLVYDAARDAAHSLFSLGNIATAAIVLGLLCMAIPTIQMARRNPQKRTRAIAGLGMLAVIAAVAVFVVLPGTNRMPSDANAQMIDGIVGPVTPTLIRVGGMKVMISCADLARCPGVKPGDTARVAYIDDSGPETSALAVRIWKRAAAAK